MVTPAGNVDTEPCTQSTTRGGKVRRFNRLIGDASVPILFILGLISLTLATIGFLKYFLLLGEDKSFATALYNAIWLFTIEPGNLPEPIPWELEIARWLSPILAMYAILLGFAAIFRNQIRLFRLRFLSRHAIICGLGQTGMMIAKNLRENDFEVVVIEKDGNHPNFASCKELGITVLLGDARDEFLLYKSGIRRARYLIAVCGDDGVNSDIALIARNLVTDRKGSKLNCAVHIKTPHLWVLLRNQEFSASERDSFRLDIFNIYDQGAKQLFRDFPLSDEFLTTDAVPHMLVVGLGDFAEQLILNAAQRWAPLFDATATKLQISIIDQEAGLFIERICQENSLIDQVCEFTTLEFEPGSVDFLKAEFLHNKQGKPNVSMIYVMIEDESIGLSSALTLLDRMRLSPVRILVRMNEEKGLVNFIRESKKNTGAYDRLFMFGLMERTCKLNLIYNSTHEAISRAIHQEYLRQEVLKGNLHGSNPIMVPWDCLPEDVKEMNRTQADDIGIKLKAIQCDLKPWCDYSGEKFIFTGAEIELMAKMEHERWCIQKGKQGWVYGLVRDDKAKTHPSMVPYDDPRLSEIEKEKDRNTVKQIPVFLALAGYQIYRL